MAASSTFILFTFILLHLHIYFLRYTFIHMYYYMYFTDLPLLSGRALERIIGKCDVCFGVIGLFFRVSPSHLHPAHVILSSAVGRLIYTR